MLTTTEKQIDDPYAWLEKAISENYIKYHRYDHFKFGNKKEISSGSFGNVSHANWNNFDIVVALKHSYNLIIMK